MAGELTMPRLSDSMDEATIIQWLKQPGDSFTRGDALVEIETDKATVVFEAEDDGVIERILVADGETAALGAPIALLQGDRATAPPAEPTVPKPDHDERFDAPPIVH